MDELTIDNTRLRQELLRIGPPAEPCSDENYSDYKDWRRS